jgi:hypothetical protein
MTKKDYELIAAAMYRARPIATLVPAELPILRQQFTLDCEAIAGALSAQNPLFNRARFLAACGIQS